MTAKIEVLDPTALNPTPTNLDQLVAQGVDDGATGLMKVPGKRGSDIVIPQAHGALHVPNKMFDAGNVVLPLWVRGINPDGTLPGTGEDDPVRVAFHQRARALCDLFAPEQVAIRHTLADGTARQITGEVTDVLDWSVRGNGRNTLGQVTIGLKCADPFWADLDPRSQTVTVTTGGTAQLGVFDGASAPMEDLLVTFGQSSNPRLEQTSSGIFVRVGKVIPSGGSITVDTAAWQVYGTAPAPTTGLYEALSYGGRGTAKWFALMPEPGGPTVMFEHTGGGSRSATITGRRRYRIA